jgi:PBP1b-binding outer membrane lipoprotein LpoB
MKKTAILLLLVLSGCTYDIETKPQVTSTLPTTTSSSSTTSSIPTPEQQQLESLIITRD